MVLGDFLLYARKITSFLYRIGSFCCYFILNNSEKKTCAESIAKQEELYCRLHSVCVHSSVTQWLNVLFGRWRFMSRASRKFHSGNLITLNYCSGLWLMHLAGSMLVSCTSSVTHLNSSYCGIAIAKTTAWPGKIVRESSNCGNGQGSRVGRARLEPLEARQSFPSPSCIEVAAGRKAQLPLQPLC